MQTKCASNLLREAGAQLLAVVDKVAIGFLGGIEDQVACYSGKVSNELART